MRNTDFSSWINRLHDESVGVGGEWSTLPLQYFDESTDIKASGVYPRLFPRGLFALSVGHEDFPVRQREGDPLDRSRLR